MYTFVVCLFCVLYLRKIIPLKGLDNTERNVEINGQIFRTYRARDHSVTSFDHIYIIYIA